MHRYKIAVVAATGVLTAIANAQPVKRDLGGFLLGATVEQILSHAHGLKCQPRSPVPEAFYCPGVGDVSVSVTSSEPKRVYRVLNVFCSPKNLVEITASIRAQFKAPSDEAQLKRWSDENRVILQVQNSPWTACNTNAYAVILTDTELARTQVSR